MSVEVAYCKWRKGKLNPATGPTKREQMASMIEAGMSSREIADTLSLSIQNVCGNLGRIGLDAEVRNMYRETRLAA